jgi:hypothetical protein
MARINGDLILMLLSKKAALQPQGSISFKELVEDELIKSLIFKLALCPFDVIMCPFDVIFKCL